MYGETALHKIVRLQRMENLKILLTKRKVKINVRDHQGETPLHKAANCKNVMLWKMLLERGGNAELHNDNHLTPFQLVKKAKNNEGIAIINQYNNMDESVA